MFRDVYEHLDYDRSATYQIKIKGLLDPALYANVPSVRVTQETSDRDHPVTMITAVFANQQELWEAIQMIHQHGYPLISIVCVRVPNNNHIRA